MAYLKKINELLEETILKNTTSKILQHMGRIRNSSSLSQARRWVMELIQNARDVSGEDGIRIRITMTDEELRFEHNGKPFRVKDILSIINQASSKGDLTESVGKFGTGFVTTFQLSESVELKSVLLESGEPAVPFHITLDRSGKTDEEIRNSIETSMEQLRNCVRSHEDEYAILLPDEFGTEFIYHLSGDYERNTARTGIFDLKNTVNEILLFSDKISEIKVIVHTRQEHREITYSVSKTGVLEGNGEISYKEFLWEETENGSVKRELHRIVYKQEDSLTVAACTDQENKILPQDENKARLFIDFPLVGSENFPFPVVVNDRRLCPNEPRSGITLVDSERSDESFRNKEIMQKAVRLYGEFLHALVGLGYEQIWNLVRIPQWQENPELSQAWVREHIYNALYRQISWERIIETDHGKSRTANPKLRFVEASTTEEKEDVYWLLTKQEKFDTADYQVDWLEILSGYETETIVLKKIGMLSILDHIPDIMRNIRDDAKAMQWLNRLYKSCMKNELYAAGIKGGYRKIYPDQMPGSFESRILHNRSFLKKDGIQDSLLREISEHFLNLHHMKEYRQYLVHKDFELEEDDLEQYTDDDLAKDIGNCINFLINTYKIDQLEESVQIGCMKLTEWIEIHLEQDEERVKNYFPQFSTEEGRAKLLTTKAVAAISRDLKQSKKKLGEMLDENEELKRRLKELEKNMQGNEASDEDMCIEDVCFAREDLEGFGGDREAFARMVGEEGEKFACEFLQESLESPEKINGKIKALLAENEGSRCEVSRADTESYKQPGYDILVKVLDQEDKLLHVEYYEVKTHTTKSKYNNVIKLSDEQMKMALCRGESYKLFKVWYDVGMGTCGADRIFDDVSGKIGTGVFHHAERGYSYYI